MDEPSQQRVFRFIWQRRLKTAAWPVVVGAGLVAVTLFFSEVRGFRYWGVLLLAGFLIFRGLLLVYRGMQTRVVIDDDAMIASGVRVPFFNAELELRTRVEKDLPVLDTVVLWPPLEGEAVTRDGVGFDTALDGFDEAVALLVKRVPEARIRVSAPGERSVKDDRREQVLVPLRGEISALQRALALLGKPQLGAPGPRN